MQPEPSPQPSTPPQPKHQDDLPRVRTFQSDVEEMMKKQQVSKATIALAESERQVKKEAEPEKEKPIVVAPSKIFSISGVLPLGGNWNMRIIIPGLIGLLVLTAIFVGALFFWKGGEEAPVVEQQTTVKETAVVTLQGGERRAGALSAMQDALKAASVSQNELKTIPIEQRGQTLDTPQFFESLETKAPPSLVRALDATTLGIHGFQGGQPFLLFKVTSYDHAFAGMLSWEETLLDDIGPLFNISSRTLLSNVGSTTDDALLNAIAIKDAIIRNKDARAIFDPEGNIVFLYSFIDKQTLVFTTNEETLRVLIGKARGGSLR